MHPEAGTATLLHTSGAPFLDGDLWQTAASPKVVTGVGGCRGQSRKGFVAAQSKLAAEKHIAVRAERSFVGQKLLVLLEYGGNNPLIARV